MFACSGSWLPLWPVTAALGKGSLLAEVTPVGMAWLRAGCGNSVTTVLWEWSSYPMCPVPTGAWPLTDSSSPKSCMLSVTKASKAFYHLEAARPKCIMGVCSFSEPVSRSRAQETYQTHHSRGSVGLQQPEQPQEPSHVSWWSSPCLVRKVPQQG